MSAANATPFAIYAQAYRIPCTFVDVQGNLITGWTAASAIAYPDNGAGTSATITEAPANSGVGYIDLSAAQMTSSMTMVVATVSNTQATAYKAGIYPLQLTQVNGTWDTQAVLRFERLVKDISNLVGIYGATQTGAVESYLNEDGSEHFNATITQNNLSATRTKVIYP